MRLISAPTKLSIAREKAGIIKPQVPVVIGKVSEEVSAVASKYCR